jgi:ribosomal protein S2
VKEQQDQTLFRRRWLPGLLTTIAMLAAYV